MVEIYTSKRGLVKKCTHWQQDNADVVHTTFGQRLRTARKAAGLTLEALARKVGTTRSALAQYENGRLVECKASMLFPICDTLKVSPRWLGTGIGPAAYVGGLSEDERDMILALRQIPESSRKHVIALAESLAAADRRTPSVIDPYPIIPGKPRK